MKKKSMRLIIVVLVLLVLMSIPKTLIYEDGESS